MDKAISILEKIYPSEMYHVHQEIYVDLRKRGGFEGQAINQEDSEVVGFSDSLCHKDYRTATWLVIFIVIAIQMAGVNVINIYTKVIFDAIEKEGGVSSLSAKTQSYFIGISGFFGAICAGFTVLYFSRRTIFIGGHSIIGVCMLAIGLFIDLGKPEICLVFMCIAVITFQFTMGAAFWVYASEVCVDVAMGICVFLMFGTLAL